MILFENRTSVDLSFDGLTDWLNACVGDDVKIRHLNYVFVSDEELREINRDHLDHDYYTDIVSFDYSRGKKIKGECWISVDRIKDNANNMSLAFEDEFHRVVCHGLLHFIGFNDTTDEEKLVMRREEDRCLGLRNKFHVKHFE